MKNRFLFIVPLITLLIGFIPFLFFSIYYSVFLSKSIVNIPLIYNSSVMIGDAILLPIFNFSLFGIIVKMADVIKRYKRVFYNYSIIFLLFSIVINLLVHLAWSNDIVTDFIAFTPGEFSIIGIWHLIFSIIQTTIFLIFILLWYLSIKTQKPYLFNKLKKIWLYFFLFTLLSIVDMIVKYIFIFTEKSFYEVLAIDKFAFVTPLMAIGIFIFFNYYERRIKITDI